MAGLTIDVDTDLIEARALVERADSDPESVRSAATALLAEVDPTEHLRGAQPYAAWALGLALRHLRELADSRRWLTRAADALSANEPDHTRVVLTLAGTLAFLGELHEADALLADVETTSDLAGRVRFQRAAIAERLGDVAHAADGYAQALDDFRRAGAQLGAAHALSGVGLIELERDQPSDALHRFRDARSLYAELGLDLLQATAAHNEGLAAMRSGDLISAIGLLAEASEELERLGQPFAETALDRIECLLLLGRPAEAARRAAEAIEILQRAGGATDRAELLTTIGAALRRSGNAELARRAFDVAGQLFAEQGRPTWVDVVELRRLESASEPTVDTLASLAAVTSRLRQAGMESFATEGDVSILAMASSSNRPSLTR